MPLTGPTEHAPDEPDRADPSADGSMNTPAPVLIGR
jgi:hypothetical protein